MEHYIRPARPDDLDAILGAIESGRQYLKAQGLPQWQDGEGPNQTVVASDLDAGHGYVLLSAGAVSGYLALIPGPDGTPPLSEGTWDERFGRYAAVHRLALGTNCRGRGLGGIFLRDAITAARVLGYRDIRIDTHPGNTIMQRAIARAGFTCVGLMHLPIPHGERLAYQLLLD